VHAYLSRELMRPGVGRVAAFDLERRTIHDSVQRILEAAASEAGRHGEGVGELHIARALFAQCPPIVLEFLRTRKVNADAAREYLSRVESEEEDTAEPRRLSMSEIEASLRKNLLGQEHAIRQVLPWIKRLRFGFPRERGAAAVLLFLGPSGTGKTQLAKELARTVYGSEDDLIVLEMGQFNSKESINLFIGAPPGYVGYGDGKLTNGLRDKPQSVVLFDEIEKAHEDVWVALLRFLDEGLIGDPAGPTRDGRKCIVVLTSNIGADRLAAMLAPETGQSDWLSDEMEDAIRTEVMGYLKRPEIYNRVDDKVVFRPFGADTYLAMVERFVALEARKFGEQFDVTVEVEREVVEWLAIEAARLRKEGARCVPRLANRFIVAPVIDVLSAADRPIRRVVVSRHGRITAAEER
jgi:ATP-dependent Clp protease ATP-binding subunit ClpC